MPPQRDPLSVRYDGVPVSELDVFCPKCGVRPGQPCQSVKHGGRIGTWPYEFHRKRQLAVLLGAPSTELLAVPVRVRALKRRSRVGAVDSAVKTRSQDSRAAAA